MPFRNFTSQFPRIRDIGNGRVEFTMGKISWIEDSDSPILGIETREEAVKLFSRMWLLKNGFRTYQELLDSPNALDLYHSKITDMKADR